MVRRSFGRVTRFVPRSSHSFGIFIVDRRISLLQFVTKSCIDILITCDDHFFFLDCLLRSTEFDKKTL